MALQDLTPQLRTRLSHMERAVGWFVLVATALLVFGFGYYIYNTAARKGWFIQKVEYQTSLNNAMGLKLGDPVTLMGFTVGDITHIEANAPGDFFGVTVYFRVKKPYFGYIWSDSTVKVAGADFLGNRIIEVTKGIAGVPTISETTNKVAVGLLNAKNFKTQLQTLAAQGKSPATALAELNQAAAANPMAFYSNLKTTGTYWLEPAESPAVTERLDRIVGQVEKALPGILSLTNELSQVLQNSAHAMSNLTIITENARPMSANLASLSAQLQGPGALGEWLLATNTRGQIDAALTKANTLLANTDTNFALLVGEFSRSLDSLANITSNLNVQVQANTNILTEISDVIVHADSLVQGLKKHWLLRSAFREPKTNAVPTALGRTVRAPNDPLKR